MRFFSPAKVNFFFRVLAKRGDGYHDIASLYSALSYGDFLELEWANEDQFISSDPRLAADSSNLVLKALKLFRQKSGKATPIAIYLDKNIPMGAGLGGGSSNAATTLWALNEMSDHPFSLGELVSMAASLGSDVPFFFSSGSAYCYGRGEIFENIARWTDEKIWIAVPQQLVSSTQNIYSNCSPNAMSSRDPRILLKDFLEGNWSIVNDLQPTAFRQVTGLEEAYGQLQGCFSHVALTGSGSGFYAARRNTTPLPLSFTFTSAQVITRNVDAWY